LQLEIDDVEAEMLKDILDCWLDGYGEATTDVEQDPMWQEPEQMLEAVTSIGDDHDIVAKLRGKVREATFSGKGRPV
jgi:hypothetical protein